MPSYTFSKEERLKSEKILSRLFQRDSNSFSKFPIRIVWIELNPAEVEEDTNPPLLQAAFTVPKRSFPKAVHRNKIKRKVREAFRLHKHILYERLPQKKHYRIMFIYTGKEALSYDKIEAAMTNIIERLIERSLKD